MIIGKKEIHEQPDSIRRALSFGGRILSNYEVILGGLNENKNILKNIDNIILLGCGTSYNSYDWYVLFKRIM